MENTIQAQTTKNSNWSVFLLSSLIITSFLFFIDEGTYSFNWARDIGGWIVFVIYALPIFTFQLIMSELVLKRLERNRRTVFGIISGAVLGTLFVMTVIF